MSTIKPTICPIETSPYDHKYRRSYPVQSPRPRAVLDPEVACPASQRATCGAQSGHRMAEMTLVSRMKLKTSRPAASPRREACRLSRGRPCGGRRNCHADHGPLLPSGCTPPHSLSCRCAHQPLPAMTAQGPGGDSIDPSAPVHLQYLVRGEIHSARPDHIMLIEFVRRKNEKKEVSFPLPANPLITRQEWGKHSCSLHHSITHLERVQISS